MWTSTVRHLFFTFTVSDPDAISVFTFHIKKKKICLDCLKTVPTFSANVPTEVNFHASPDKQSFAEPLLLQLTFLLRNAHLKQKFVKLHLVLCIGKSAPAAVAARNRRRFRYSHRLWDFLLYTSLNFICIVLWTNQFQFQLCYEDSGTWSVAKKSADSVYFGLNVTLVSSFTPS